jgi:glycosyltransferase involved in cell wall biosynthesis
VSRRNVLFLSSAPVGGQMIGPAIRAYEMARALAGEHDVTLAAVQGSEPAPPLDVPHVPFNPADPRSLRPLVDAADVIVGQPQWPVVARWLANSRARLIFDLYDPETLESIEFFADRHRLLRWLMTTLSVDRLLDALYSGHHFVCASRRQRDLWIGTMLAERLIQPSTYDRDPTLESVIDLVPFGLSDQPPRHPGGGGARERFALQPDDEIVLWNGGIWSWLDPETAVEAIGLLARQRPRARLVFMGVGSQAPAKRASAAARARAERLGLLNEHVFFNQDWVPYDERAAWLLDAQCAISTHVEHLESSYAFRTRLLDCFWAGLPVVCTRGDDLADRVERDDLGGTAPERDPVALAAALDHVLTRGRDAYAEPLRKAAADYTWPRVVEPLRKWIADDTPPVRLGDARALRRRHPMHGVRTSGFVAARGTLRAIGVSEWPRFS